MTRYYFHTQTDTRFSDVDGTELASPLLARGEAIRLAGDLMREEAEQFWGSRPWAVTVTDKRGLILWEISMDGVSAPGAPAIV